MAALEITQYIVSNPLTVFNTLLLLFTGYLSYNSYIFQTRTSIRESLEQLEDIEFRRGKLRPILHSYEHSLLSNSSCMVELKYYKEGRNPASANQPADTFRFIRYKLANDHDDLQAGNPIEEEIFLNAVEQSIPTPRGIVDARVNNSGIFLYINSDDAVFIRRITEGVLLYLHETLLQGPTEIVDDLELENEL